MLGDDEPQAFARLEAAATDVLWSLHFAHAPAKARIDGDDPPFEALRIVREAIEMEEAPESTASPGRHG
jgi:hypothetical protein